MKLFTTILSTVLAFASISLSAEQEFSVDVGAGYRHDDIKGCFKNMDFYTINARARVISECYYGRFDADYGWMNPKHKKECFALYPAILEDESCSELDFNFKTKQNGYAYDFSAAVGYPFVFECGTFQVIPVIGYSFHKIHQDEKTHDKFCDSSCADCSTSFVGCNDWKCKADWKWYSPFIGVDLAYNVSCFDFFAELEYHPNFFQHKKFQQGFVGAIGATYNIDCNWNVGVRVDYKYFAHNKKKRHCESGHILSGTDSCSNDDFCGLEGWVDCCTNSVDIHSDVKSIGARVEVSYLF